MCDDCFMMDCFVLVDKLWIVLIDVGRGILDVVVIVLVIVVFVLDFDGILVFIVDDFVVLMMV